MNGWMAFGLLYALSVAVFWKLSRDPLHKLLAFVWPLNFLYLVFTAKN